MIDLTKDSPPGGQKIEVLAKIPPLAKSTPRQVAGKPKSVRDPSVIRPQASGDVEEPTSHPLGSERIANISVDVGIQTDFQESLPATPGEKSETALSTRPSVRKIQPLVVKHKQEPSAAPVPIRKEKPGLVRVPSPPNIGVIHSPIATTSPKEIQLAKGQVAVTLNSRIIEVTIVLILTTPHTKLSTGSQ